MLIVPGFGLRSFIQSLLCHIREALDFATLHPTRVLRQRAIAQTADYISAHMDNALSFYTARQVLRHCLAGISANGMILEFGVFKGGTIRYIARAHPDREIHGFDSFDGLPSGWSGTGHDKGAFSAGGRLPRVPKNVRLHIGLFDTTLPAWTQQNKGPIALLHVDCDLYSSTQTVLAALKDRMIPGTIIVFDDYFGYPGWQRGEHLAFQEFVLDTDLRFEYICHAFHQVAVRILSAADQAS
jgi:Methyltransferase domain